MATEEQLIEGLRRADEAGNTADAQAFADAIKTMRAQGGSQKDPSEYQGPTDTRRGTYGFGDELREQGAMLGYGDELSAGASTASDTLQRVLQGQAPQLSSDYDKELKFRRAQRAEWESKHPVAKYVAPALGGAGSIGAGKAIQAVKELPTFTQQVMRSAGTGAGIGGVAGFGSGEGGYANRTLAAAGGATLGAGIGVLAPVAVEGARGLYGATTAMLGLRSPEQTATREVATAIARSGKTQDEIADAVQRANELGVPGTPADTSESLRRLGRAVETIPGAASRAATELLNERQIGQAGRVAGQLKGALGTEGHALETADALIRAREAAADPLYKKAFEATNVWSPELDELLKTDAGRAAYARAKVIASNKRVPADEMAVLGQRLDPSGQFGSMTPLVPGANITGKTPTMRSWHYLKMGLDDIIEGYRNPVTGKLNLPPHAESIQSVKNGILRELDRINPAYGEARQSFAGHSEMLDALHMGQDFAKGGVETNARRFGELSDAEKDMFRVGAVNDLRRQINTANDGADMYARIFGSPDKRARISMLFKDPRQFQTFSQIMELERQTTKTARTVLGGSPTGRIAAEQADLVAGALEDALLHGHGPLQVAWRAGTRMISRAKGMNEETAGKIAAYLFNPDANAARQTINPQAVQQSIAATRRRVGATAIGSRALTTGATVNATRPTPDSYAARTRSIAFPQ